MSITTHECNICKYTTNRRYNLERHMSVVHSCHDLECATKVVKNTTKVAGVATKVAVNTTKVAQEATYVAPETLIAELVIQNDGIEKYKCSGCDKLFTRKYRCVKHFNNCKMVTNPLECSICNNVCSSKYALYRHKKTCIPRVEETKKDLIVPPQQIGPKAIFNTSGEHNTINSIDTQNNTINILAFPSGMQDDNFAFVKDHITPALLANIMKKKPEQAFANYIGTLMEKEENRMIKKQSPNVNFCSVHTGENQWDLVLDHDAIPVLAHHVTRSSFEDILKNKKKLSELQVDVDKLRKYIDDINTENTENDNYNLSLQRIKLMLVNFTRKWGKDEKDL